MRIEWDLNRIFFYGGFRDFLVILRDFMVMLW